jgi:t-SNARE complex subunit (syntaxin)
MTTKAAIKIIKRNDRNLEKNVAKGENAAKKSTQETARDMVATVTDWVNEFQQKRRTGTKQAFRNLFPDPPQPSEV